MVSQLKTLCRVLVRHRLLLSAGLSAAAGIILKSIVLIPVADPLFRYAALQRPSIYVAFVWSFAIFLFTTPFLVLPKFRGLRIAESAIHRTIDIFGTGCGLVACKPWPLQFTPSVADDPEALKKFAPPNIHKGEALRKLRSYWSRLGFWPLGDTGIYLLSLSQRGCEVYPRDRGKSLSITPIDD